MQNIIFYFLSVNFEVKCDPFLWDSDSEVRLRAEDLSGDKQTCRRVFQAARESTD